MSGIYFRPPSGTAVPPERASNPPRTEMVTRAVILSEPRAQGFRLNRADADVTGRAATDLRGLAPWKFATPLHIISLTVSVILMAIPAAAHGKLRSESLINSHLQATRGAALRVTRSDRLIIRGRTIFCVSITADPKAIANVQSSGEELRSWTVASFANDTAIAIIGSLQSGADTKDPAAAPSERVVVGARAAASKKCARGADTVSVSLRVSASSSGEGYSASIAAQQGRRSYIARIDREALTFMPMEGRALISIRTHSTPDGRPYWDLAHDITKLSDAFIAHMLRSMNR